MGMVRSHIRVHEILLTDLTNRWLSIVWQFFWAWLYAPYVLWKTRDVKDTHGWRIQTILCCIAGLPCSPLWLCGLYLPQFAPVNAVLIPPGVSNLPRKS